jgi:hypothetical protein
MYSLYQVTLKASASVYVCLIENIADALMRSMNISYSEKSRVDQFCRFKLESSFNIILETMYIVLIDTFII